MLTSVWSWSSEEGSSSIYSQYPFLLPLRNGVVALFSVLFLSLSFTFLTVALMTNYLWTYWDGRIHSGAWAACDGQGCISYGSDCGYEGDPEFFGILNCGQFQDMRNYLIAGVVLTGTAVITALIYYTLILCSQCCFVSFESSERMNVCSIANGLKFLSWLCGQLTIWTALVGGIISVMSWKLLERMPLSGENEWAYGYQLFIAGWAIEFFATLLFLVTVVYNNNYQLPSKSQYAPGVVAMTSTNPTVSVKIDERPGDVPNRQLDVV